MTPLIIALTIYALGIPVAIAIDGVEFGIENNGRKKEPSVAWLFFVTSLFWPVLVLPWLFFKTKDHAPIILMVLAWPFVTANNIFTSCVYSIIFVGLSIKKKIGWL